MVHLEFKRRSIARLEAKQPMGEAGNALDFLPIGLLSPDIPKEAISQPKLGNCVQYPALHLLITGYMHCACSFISMVALWRRLSRQPMGGSVVEGAASDWLQADISSSPEPAMMAYASIDMAKLCEYSPQDGSLFTR